MSARRRSLNFRNEICGRWAGCIDQANVAKSYFDSRVYILHNLLDLIIVFKKWFPKKDKYPFGRDSCSLDIYFEGNDNLLATFREPKLGTNKFAFKMHLKKGKEGIWSLVGNFSYLAQSEKISRATIRGHQDG